MFYGAAAIFDADTDAAVRAQWQAVAGAGLRTQMTKLDYPPHLTLMGAEALDTAAFRAALTAFAARTAPLPVHLSSVGTFPGEPAVAFLTPTINRALLDFHAAFWQAAGPLVQGITSYNPDVWVPHVTVAYPLRARELGAAVDVLASGWQPISGRIVGILFGGYNLQGPSDLEVIMLNGGKG
jgi:hypothetical protein